MLKQSKNFKKLFEQKLSKRNKERMLRRFDRFINMQMTEEINTKSKDWLILLRNSFTQNNKTTGSLNMLRGPIIKKQLRPELALYNIAKEAGYRVSQDEDVQERFLNKIKNLSSDSRLTYHEVEQEIKISEDPEDPRKIIRGSITYVEVDGVRKILKSSFYLCDVLFWAILRESMGANRPRTPKKAYIGQTAIQQDIEYFSEYFPILVKDIPVDMLHQMASDLELAKSKNSESSVQESV